MHSSPGHPGILLAVQSIQVLYGIVPFRHRDFAPIATASFGIGRSATTFRFLFAFHVNGFLRRYFAEKPSTQLNHIPSYYSIHNSPEDLILQAAPVARPRRSGCTVEHTERRATEPRTARPGRRPKDSSILLDSEKRETHTQRICGQRTVKSMGGVG